jgi:hypothetical protein
MNQQTLENVVVLSQVRAPHAAGFVAVRETALDQLAPPTQQPLPLGPFQPLPIRVDGLLLAFFTNPVPLPILFLLRNVSAYASSLQLFQNGSAGRDRTRTRRSAGGGLPFPPFRLRDGISFPPWPRFPRPPNNPGRPDFPGPVLNPGLSAAGLPVAGEV